MITLYRRTDQGIEISNGLSGPLKKEGIVWIDLFQPDESEVENIEIFFNIKLPTKEEREEIEMSSRYWEDSCSIKISSYFFVSFFFVENAKSHYNESVSFVLQDNILFTIRESELQTFDIMGKYQTRDRHYDERPQFAG